jgi:hypothetical protein
MATICEGALAPGEPYWVHLHDFLLTQDIDYGRDTILTGSHPGCRAREVSGG